jgi:hypothetical protein
MQCRTTAKSAYRCDTDLLIREVLEAAHGLYARTAREPCRLFVHPLDGRALIMAPIGTWGPVVGIDADSRPRFRNMAMFYDPEMQPGMARVEICDGCLSMWRDCEHGTRRAADLEGTARLIVDALADLGDEWARPRPRAGGLEPTETRAPETPPVPAGKRTRRPSKRELERRAETAARKAAEATKKAENARRTLEEGS